MTLNVTHIERVSTTSSGGQTNGGTLGGVLSTDGTKLLFSGEASNLVANDTNQTVDVFMKDLVTGEVTLISGSPTGAVGNSNSEVGGFSPDGTKVLFYSAASNLVSGETEIGWDIFVKDLVTGTVTLVSMNGEGIQANGASVAPSFSPDGTKITFASTAWNYVEGDPDPAGGPFTVQVYVKDLVTGEVTRVSSTPDGERGNGHSEPSAWSPDGTKIAFYTYADNLAPDGNPDFSNIVVKDLTTGALTLVSTHPDGSPVRSPGLAKFSPDGTKLVFTSDESGQQDIYIKDLVTGSLMNISKTISGIPANSYSAQPVFSPDGTRIAFTSEAWNLAAGDNSHHRSDVFVKDLITGVVSRIAVNESGEGGNSYSGYPVFSADGSKIVFTSEADNLVTGDTNGRTDIFIATLQEDNVINGTSNVERVNGRETGELFKMRDGNDFAYGKGGNDVLHGGDGNDYLSGGNGDDRVLGENNNDILYGGSGNDELRGGEGDDKLYGDNGNDFLSGDNGNDTLFGGGGSDKLRGGEGDDMLDGGTANDDLRAGNGNDTLNGGNNGDDLYGEGGSDRFVFDVSAFVGGRDTIKDFSVAQGDIIVLDDLLIGYNASTGAIADFVTGTEASGRTMLMVDRDGDASAYSFQAVTAIQGVVGLNIENMYATGALLVA